MENLKSFLDGELDLATSAEVETHLRQDQDLEKMASDFRALSSTLKTVDAGTPYGLDALEAKLASPARKPAETKRIWQYGFGSAIVGVMLVAVMFPVFAQPKVAAKRMMQERTEMMPMAADAAAPAAPEAKSSIAYAESEARDEEQSKTLMKAEPHPTINGSTDGSLAFSTPTNTPGAPYGVYLEKSGSVTVKVEDLIRSVDEVTGIVSGLKGFVVTSNVQNQEQGGTARMTLRIPTDNFPTAMNRLQSMGEVLEVNSSSNDITAETVDSGARTRSWADEEARLIKELSRAKTENQKWRIRAELNNVRANLEAYRAQLKNLKDRGNFSTIEVTFTREGSSSGKGWAGGAWNGAKGSLGSVGQVVGTLGIYFLVFTPVWLPIAIAAYMVKRRR